jgi:hypothetical protein
MTRKELHDSILLLIEEADVDPRRKEILITGINDAFHKFGVSWLSRNAKPIGTIVGTAISYIPIAGPKILKFFKR